VQKTLCNIDVVAICGLQANVDIWQLEGEHRIFYVGTGYNNRQVRQRTICQITVSKALCRGYV